MTWIDVSIPIRPGMFVYEGDPAVTLERASSIAAGDTANNSRLNFGLHTGTHVDAPVHFIEGATGVEAIKLDALIGSVTIVDATMLTAHIDSAALASLALPTRADRIIFKTPNSWLWDREAFSSDFVGLTEDAAEVLVRRGVRLVGIDYLSIAPKDDPAPTHVALLKAGVVILEGLDLRQVQPGEYDLICAPLLIPGSDGGPARVLIRQT